jgi:hypothetical protein
VKTRPFGREVRIVAFLAPCCKRRQRENAGKCTSDAFSSSAGQSVARPAQEHARLGSQRALIS